MRRENPRFSQRVDVTGRFSQIKRALAIACLGFASMVASAGVLAQTAPPAQLIQQLRDLRVAGEPSADAVQKLKSIERAVPEDAPYALRRALEKTRMFVLQDSLSFDDSLKLMKSLSELAKANGDADTVSLMDIRRIYMSHADDDIGKFIDQLNEVRAQIRSDASPEVMEALEVSYGNLYFDAGNFDTALRHELAALDWAAKLPFGRERARLYRLGTIAELYNAMELPEQALVYLDRAQAEALDAAPVQNRISLLTTRAMALMKAGRLADAEATYAEVTDLAREGDSTFTDLRLGTLHAELLLAREQPERAIETIDRSEALATKSANAYYLARCWLLRGQAQMLLNQLDAGSALMEKAIKYFQSKGQMIDVLGGLDRQIQTLRAKQQYARAVVLLERRQQLWSQLFRNERGRAIAEVEALHTAQELERQIDTLSIENRVQDQSLRAERLGKILALVLALLAISVSAMLFMAIRRARRERDRLSDAVRLDALTGASSRYQFQRRHDEKRVIEPAATSAAGLLLLDLDHFKAINDQHGHEAGDAVLKAAVERIRGVLKEHDELYRWGGEEFLVVLKRDDAQSLDREVVRLLTEIERAPVPWHGQAMAIRISGGYVHHPIAPGWQTPLVDAIRWADAALYHAKNSGRQRIEKIELTDLGRIELNGRRPIDMPQLLDWQRRGFLHLRTLFSAVGQ